MFIRSRFRLSQTVMISTTGDEYSLFYTIKKVRFHKTVLKIYLQYSNISGNVELQSISKTKCAVKVVCLYCTTENMNEKPRA